MKDEQRKFELYLTILRFLVFKITFNLKRIYLDINLEGNKILLTAFYLEKPSELELELLDDIVTNSNAHIPDLFIDSQIKLVKNHSKDDKHDFIVFAVYDDI